MNMDGKIAVVTGAASGIGRATAQAMAEAGVAGLALVDLHEGVDETAAGLANAESYRCDLGSVTAIRATFAAIYERFGQVDACAFPGGFSYRTRTLEVTEEEWDNVINANLRGAFFCNQEALKLMYEQGSGAIVNMSADAAFFPIEGFALQAAMKGGVWHMTQTLALEAAPKGVRVNCVSPGNTKGGGFGARVPRSSWPWPEDHKAMIRDVLRAVPRGDMLETREVADVITFLCSDAASGVSGELLHINSGGYYTMVF